VQSWGEDAGEIAKRIARKHTGAMAASVRCMQWNAVGKGRAKGKVIVRRNMHVDKPAAHIEFGTKHNRAFPFIFAAIYVARKNRIQRIAQTKSLTK
jgi:hypothetical protein